MVLPLCRYVHIDDIDVCYFTWSGSNQSTVLLVHATGFHARCWDSTVAELGSEFNVVALDMRSHGRTTTRGPYHWSRFGQDIQEFIRALDLSNLIAVGHSMGGHSIVQACAADPNRFKGLVLVDPVIPSPEALTAAKKFPSWSSVESHPVARRRNAWQSPGEMYEAFKHRHPFSLWTKRCLRDYCNWGLLFNNSQHYELACPPKAEASIYMGSRDTDLNHLFKHVRQPVCVMRAQPVTDNSQAMDFSKSPTWPNLYRQFSKGRDLYLPELTHFIPMQQPHLVAREIKRLNTL